MLGLVDLLEPNLSFTSNREMPLSPQQQTCVAMSYLASSTFQRTAGLLAGVSKTCAHSTIHRVTRAIYHLAGNFIKVPSEDQMKETADFFMQKYGLPNFACGVDGTKFP